MGEEANGERRTEKKGVREWGNGREGEWEKMGSERQTENFSNFVYLINDFSK